MRSKVKKSLNIIDVNTEIGEAPGYIFAYLRRNKIYPSDSVYYWWYWLIYHCDLGPVMDGESFALKLKEHLSTVTGGQDGD